MPTQGTHSWFIWFSLSLIANLSLGKLDEALEYFNKALAADPSDLKAKLKVALTLQDFKKVFLLTAARNIFLYIFSFSDDRSDGHFWGNFKR